MLDVTTFSFFFFEWIEFKMATILRPELSPKNKYYIDKHRYYELKHFCLQYSEWKKSYSAFDDTSLPLSMIKHIPTLYSYIIKGVIEGKSYTYLKTKLGIPCGRDMYYKRYRKFFWILNKSREKHLPL